MKGSYTFTKASHTPILNLKTWLVKSESWRDNIGNDTNVLLFQAGWNRSAQPPAHGSDLAQGFENLAVGEWGSIYCPSPTARFLDLWGAHRMHNVAPCAILCQCADRSRHTGFVQHTAGPRCTKSGQYMAGSRCAWAGQHMVGSLYVGSSCCAGLHWQANPKHKPHVGSSPRTDPVPLGWPRGPEAGVLLV